MYFEIKPTPVVSLNVINARNSDKCIYIHGADDFYVYLGQGGVANFTLDELYEVLKDAIAKKSNKTFQNLSP